MTRDDIKQLLANGHAIDRLADGGWILAGTDVPVPGDLISEPWEGVWTVTTTPTFNHDNIEFLKTAQTYQKRALTRAQRIEGPFEVLTKEGWLRCEDGYLAMDVEGNPYPIAKTVFEQTYMRIGFEEKAKGTAAEQKTE